MAGYSGTPLPQKLGIKPGARVALIRAPAGFVLGATPADAVLLSSLRGKAGFDVIVFFTDSRAALADQFAVLVARLTTSGGLWIAWPKKASGMQTDLTEDIVREIGLGHGLVDNKVCAVDETWSGLRFVRRLKDR
jgi:hypothetical protein